MIRMIALSLAIGLGLLPRAQADTLPVHSALFHQDEPAQPAPATWTLSIKTQPPRAGGE